ncbi:50S ribosomal protein L11 [Borrelia miyamotoi]|uniref:Large ribosomal subunit protein uL11 n=1 Tax=Borrelia miyamotoi TaxID=47466 RepID=A0AAQ2WWQ7_9SPIR|nr:50S ribosomal protein L11 [Borrelia miyamotoi]AGT26983.1 50S ribosomal protein L11 [Borrelia miyamotoi LB-2001]AJA58557.1 50S ribosomal protein L11 [Borrelia miyamotoi]AOW95635.1 50S ribosomal protein L11 [Borrelia miyamotoi]QTL83518.1 50S ribosomal protein L11 [Borrelia miyamotoi]WAZ85187.1 50S ribosomal protein L11 [Borrelia miyamotoi]
MSDISKKKKEIAWVKLQIPAAQAAPGAKIGQALGPHGVSGPQFVKEFNERTAKMEPGVVVPVIITIYRDKSFSFVVKTPPASVLIKKAIGVEIGSKKSNTEKVGTISKEKIMEIAKVKMPDLNAKTEMAAFKIIAGSARSMGVEVEK